MVEHKVVPYGDFLKFLEGSSDVIGVVLKEMSQHHVVFTALVFCVEVNGMTILCKDEICDIPAPLS